MVPLSLVTSVRRPLLVCLYTNYLSFTPLSYKIGLIRTLIDRVFKINNTWLGFLKDIILKLVFILRKNLFPVHLIDKCVYRYLNTAINRNGSCTQTPPSPNTISQGKQYFYKLPYLGRFSTVAQSKILRLVNHYCNDLDIKLVFTTFKLRNLFSVKDSVPSELRSRMIYKFILVLAVMLAISVKLVVIFSHESVNISLMTSSHTSSNTYKAQNAVVSLALWIVSKSLIPPPLNFNLNLRRLCV